MSGAELLDLLRGGADPESFTGLDVVLAIAVSFVLACAIAFTYQWTHRGAMYAQAYAHTLVVMAMVTAVVVMVVGGSVARAFAVFGAFSMIRFRNALPETRDLGFIFFAMAVGMAAGAGRHDMAALTTALICAIIVALWRFDLFGAARAMQLLRVRMTNDVDPAVLDEILARHADRVRLLSVESVQAGMLTEVSYAIRLRPGASAHALLAETRERSGNNRVVLLSTVPEPGADDR